jgi:hypothetical protein
MADNDIVKQILTDNNYDPQDYDIVAQVLKDHGYDPSSPQFATPQPRSRWDMLRDDALHAAEAIAPFSAMRYPDTPEARRAYNDAWQNPAAHGYRLPPTPGSPRFTPGQGALLDVASNLLPVGKIAGLVGSSVKAIAGVAPAARAAFEGPPGLLTRVPPLIGGQATSRLGGSQEARAMFERYIAPHYSENEFAEKYFAGLHHPSNIAFDSAGTRAPELQWEGALRDPVTGKELGWISRAINPTEGIAEHDSLRLNPSAQGDDLGKRLLTNQIGMYQKMGLNRVNLTADGPVGSYSWAKYGWLPRTTQDWSALAQGISERMAQMSRGSRVYGRIDSADRRDIATMLRYNDPSDVWSISDLETPTGAIDKRGNPMTLGKALLLDQRWRGSLNLNGPDQMERFYDYVGRTR